MPDSELQQDACALGSRQMLEVFGLTGKALESKVRSCQTPILALLSAAVGVAAVLASVRVSYLNWIVDAPGWLVSRFVSIDFHEGDGAAGFAFAMFLSWLWSTIAFFCVARWFWKWRKSAASSRER
jgi:hypothetical protein